MIIALAFIIAGVNHFYQPRIYQAIMPPYLPWPGPLVALSGWAEIILGALILLPPWRRPAGWGLMALLVAVFPANLHMALNSAHFAAIPAWVLWLRLPMQPLLIAWVEWCTREG